MTEQQLKNFFNKYDEIDDKIHDIIHIIVGEKYNDCSIDDWEYSSFDNTIKFTYTIHHGGDWNTTKHSLFPLSWLTLNLSEVKNIWKDKMEKEKEDERLNKEREEQIHKQQIEDFEKFLYQKLQERYGNKEK